MVVKHVVLSGCSGGGKSTLLAELGRRGFAVVAEPGRQIVEEELRGDGAALPWVNLAAFARRALEVAESDRKRMAAEPSWVFFDRGLIDAAVALQHAGCEPTRDTLGRYERYHTTVFMTPPWPQIYVTDDERQHDLVDAIMEYEHLLIAYKELGYDTIILPKIGVCERADFVINRLG